jgi:hypothetical protein
VGYFFLVQPHTSLVQLPFHRIPCAKHAFGQRRSAERWLSTPHPFTSSASATRDDPTTMHNAIIATATKVDLHIRYVLRGAWRAVDPAAGPIEMRDAGQATTALGTAVGQLYAFCRLRGGVSNRACRQRRRACSRPSRDKHDSSYVTTIATVQNRDQSTVQPRFSSRDGRIWRLTRWLATEA